MTTRKHECFMPEREVGRVEHPDIIDDEHGGLAFGGGFKYRACGQGFGYRIDIEFVQKFMRVFGDPRSLKSTEGRACWVTHCNSTIHKIEPLLPNEGEVFDVDGWAEEAYWRDTVVREARKCSTQ